MNVAEKYAQIQNCDINITAFSGRKATEVLADANDIYQEIKDSNSADEQEKEFVLIYHEALDELLKQCQDEQKNKKIDTPQTKTMSKEDEEKIAGYEKAKKGIDLVIKFAKEQSKKDEYEKAKRGIDLVIKSIKNKYK